jgi:hypothetical protein
MLEKLIFSVPSLLGFLLVVVSCFLTRRLRPLIIALVAGVLLHLFSAVIQSQPLGSEPSGEAFAEAHEYAVFYFFDGLPLFAAPFLIKFLCVYLGSSKRGRESAGGS